VGVFSLSPSSLLADTLDLTDDSYPRFPVKGDILSIGGDALVEMLLRLLYFRIEYRLMISVQPKTVTKVPLNTQRPFYVFTSGRVIISVQIHSRKKLFKGG